MDIVEELRIMAPYYPVQGKAADEIERLRDELDTWMSVFPDLAPESVLPDRSNLEKEIERLREALHQISLASQSSMDSKEGCGKIARKALGEKE
jgi:hypothetical protein